MLVKEREGVDHLALESDVATQFSGNEKADVGRGLGV